MVENQRTISQWAEQTFGNGGNNARVAARANEEMAELLRVLTIDDWDRDRAADEVADVVIVLYRLAERMHFDLNMAVTRKMQTNRERTWARDGSSHGYHHVANTIKDGGTNEPPPGEPLPPPPPA